MKKFLTAWCLAFLLCGPAYADECAAPPYCETRAYFTDWLAACRPTEPLFCSINTYLHNKDAPAGFDYQLRLARPAPGAPLELSLIAVDRFVTTSKEMIFDIPGLANLVVTPEKLSTPEAVNDYVIEDPAILQELIPAMKRGYFLTIRFTDGEGHPASIRFSLMGFTAALAFMEEQSKTPKSAEAPPL